jgi:hypothetical protein
MAAKSAPQQTSPQNLSYAQYLQRTPQDRLQSELQYAIQEKKSSWEVNISKTRASLERSNYNLQQAMASADMTRIVEYTREVRGYSEGLAILEQAFAQLFPIEVA